jgi:riboflavin kinase/FMN adenylyltransferase
VYGFEVEEIPAKDIDNVDISSTKIRKALLEGNIKLANDFLGYEYMLNGTISKGAGLGTKLGFPTANISIEEKYKLLPANNVYAIKAIVNGEQYQGMLNIGVRPTLENQQDYQPAITIEAHLFDCNDSIYGLGIRIKLVEKIREEKKFESLDELKAQLHNDKIEALKILAHHN